MENKIIIGLGKGRDGTVSLAKNIENIIQLNQSKYPVHHEKYVKEIYNNLNKYYKNKKILERKNNLTVKKFKIGNIYIGNGYILILDILKKKFGNKLRVINIYRNKKDWQESFKKNVKFYPTKHGNYSKVSKPEIFRMAAFHFDEVSKKNWNKWSLLKKLSWYYNKNNDLLKKIIISKSNKFSLSNHQLTKKKFIKKITEFLNPKWKMPENVLKVNVSKIDYKILGAFEKKIVGTFYKNFDYLEAAKNPSYGFEFFLEKIKSGYKYRNEYIHSSISKKQLNFIKRLIKKFLINLN